MTQKMSAIVALVGLAVLFTACESSKSSNPLSPTVAGPIPGVVISAPTLLTPSAGQRVAFTDQPLTLTVANATTSGVRPLTYTFEIAGDAGFTNKVYTRQGVDLGSNGKTSVTLTDSLASGHTYYWRAQAVDGANSGVVPSAVNFDVYTPVVIQAPALVSPFNGTKVTVTKPVFTVTDATRTGPAGAMTYNFQVSDSQAFANLVINAAVPEGSGQTTYTATIDLSYGKTYYWRVRASDPTTTGPWSVTQSFVTPDQPTTPTPTPTPGSPSGIDATKAVFIDNPPINTWAETAKITRVDFSQGYVVVDFDKRTGSNRWPDVPFGSGTVEYTLGMCANLSGQWYCSAVIQFWYGRELEAGGRMDEIATNWYYDGRWRQLQGWQPQIGESVGIFVGAGNLRDGNNWIVEERSNILLIPYGTNYNR